MCGIAGWVGGAASVEHRREVVSRMLASITHRGPDDDGLYVDQTASIGMRRLSIIDLAGGHQPMPDEQRRIWVVQNGEIYNYRDLTTLLGAKGHRFATRSDTEVLVHGFEEWGEHLPQHLRGMFAFAAWDSEQRRLLLAVDPLGIKPLYFAELKEGLLFASELKSLTASGLIAKEIDEDAVSQFFALGYITAPTTIYRSVRKLRPGHLLTWGEASTYGRRYWDVPLPDPQLVDGSRLREQVRDALEDAVRSHLVSDVPVGAFLSGGLDSGTVVSLMARTGLRSVETFTIGFAEKEYDERPLARLVAESVGSKHRERELSPPGAAEVERIIAHFDEPFGDASALPTDCVSSLASSSVKVIVSGTVGMRSSLATRCTRDSNWRAC